MRQRTLKDWRNAVDFRVGDLYEHLAECSICQTPESYCTAGQNKYTKTVDAVDKMVLAPVVYDAGETG